ncbi:EscU/YscU/HrcU family type III secretion system export apparatus switch protein [Paradevosia shaoguanensis]|uniref:EscU/YscU/HrcU family type III secretion system export apparatus switch protein n=1 Tax=Paradevosia shaoguanensis TaxID=1335043 RepID=A0AA41UD91_9HYPH|nr:EscU/YscU/HrcU family type III secretion system export apparatus switch protein [Paradevosia shaoguanensis]MCF1744604.1 EscU/YscU/HrcU family type III secretion system export apparatus switch protein [Paradevosia shaoguanensis]MCI0129087.1 EscU/YscU/HrcU family type III secretion system export apparatus switch protein [Paradevosia shaoguanensis]QMV00626.1 type III secretion protein [Devosia sp. D6-9]CDP51952.1 Flagellar biosynthesis protein FlhB [Devosia sp. DBB001]
MNGESGRRIAVAMEYEEGSREAPRVTAKGFGLMAERIVALAEENDVAIEANPLLAQALAEVELDQNIPLELFEAAAEVIGFVLRARHRL